MQKKILWAFLILALIYILTKFKSKKMEDTTEDKTYLKTPADAKPSIGGADSVKAINERYGKVFPKITNFFKIDSTNKLNEDLVLFLQKQEGGLGKSVEDSASKFPSPYAYLDKKTGKVVTGWHTNKGVTYATFKANQNLGYTDTKENFYNMPFDIWYKIFYEKFYKRWATYTKSQVINIFLCHWAWGSGYGGATALLKKIGQNSDTLNALIDKVGERKVFAYLVNERINFFKRLVEQKPQNIKWLQGWINGVVSFYVTFEKYCKS